jgi:hypothetical protein
MWLDAGDLQVVDDGFLKICGHGWRIVADFAFSRLSEHFPQGRRESERICSQPAIDEPFFGVLVKPAFRPGDIALMGHLENLARQASSPHEGTSLEKIWAIIPLKETQSTR